MRATKAEIAEAKAESEFWHEFADPLNLRVFGWNRFHYATLFDREDGSEVQMPGWLAKRIVEQRQGSMTPRTTAPQEER